MGTGKTAVAKALARQLKMSYVDLDDLIEAREGMKISDIFAQKGEDHFRNAETAVIKDSVGKIENTAIATGGGCVINPENMKNLKKLGPVILLKARPEIILERTKKSSHRPLLQVGTRQCLVLDRIKELLELRAPYYAKADHEIDGTNLTVEEIAEKIIEHIDK